MGVALSTCKDLLESSCLEDRPAFLSDGAQRQLHLKLRVDASPIRASMGTLMPDFKLTDEFNVDSVELLQSFEPFCWRHERSRQSNHQSWPGGPRCSVPVRYVRVRVCGQTAVLVVAIAPEHRTMEHVLQTIEDSKDVATYAHSFNAHLMQAGIADGQDSFADEGQGPRVRVCVPIGCRVLSSAVPQFAHPGAVVTLIPYIATEVNKYIFDGREEFIEVPQAFFHYVVWMSGGRESLYDLQGVEGDDGEFFIVDPCLVRAPKTGPLTSLVDSHSDSTPTCGPSQETFDAMHPKCGLLCRGFDPQRRGAKHRKMCGLNMPSCGMP